MSDYQHEFNSIIKGVNFVTPKVIEYFSKMNSDYICELSTSNNMFGNNFIYGVTVVSKSKKKNTDYSKAFIAETRVEAEQSARDYIKEILSIR